MKLGYTGTREGMSRSQKDQLEEIFRTTNVTEFHHGDCIGADEEAHDIANSFGIRIIIHPPLSMKFRANCHIKRTNRVPIIVLSEEDYIPRNHSIVDSTDSLVGAPRSDIEELRSGTWSTIRYAKKSKPVIILKR